MIFSDIIFRFSVHCFNQHCEQCKNFSLSNKFKDSNLKESINFRVRTKWQFIRAISRTQLNIYDGDFYVKIVNGSKVRMSFVFYLTSFRLAIYLWTKLIYPVECVLRQKTTVFSSLDGQWCINSKRYNDWYSPWAWMSDLFVWVECLVCY